MTTWLSHLSAKMPRPPAGYVLLWKRSETPIGAYDLLIAGQALRRSLTVVTANTSDSSRVTGLSWEDWTT